MKSTPKPRLCFVIRSLAAGGSERQLVELTRGLAANGYPVSVVTLYTGGVFAEELRAQPGIEVHSAIKSGRWDVGSVARLCACVRATRPDLIHTYMASANLLSPALRLAVPRAKLVWGIRSSDVDLSKYDHFTRAQWALERRISRMADLIIANSMAGKSYAVSKGFPEEIIHVVPNGIDTRRFAPDPAARLNLRARWGVSASVPLVGLVARIDPMKDHATFLLAAAKISSRSPEARFVCIGGGPEAELRKLQDYAAGLGIAEKTLWIGYTANMPEAHNALDVAVSSSVSEGFPNAVGEAMATGVPCVVTDVGDCAVMVGDTGYVVPPRQPDSLADACLDLLKRTTNGEAVGKRARERIEKNYRSELLIQRTSSLLDQLMVCSVEIT